MEINNKELTEAEKSKVEKMICPKCNDGLRKFTKTQVKDGREYTCHWVDCINYYCPWEACINETSE